MAKVVTVIQGNIRPGFNEVLRAVQRFSDAVVLSTWRCEHRLVPEGEFELVLNDPPIERGITNRNLQRVSTVSGLRRAKELGADFVLKWRTDLLPTAITKKQLLDWVMHDVPRSVPSRLLLSPFRSAALTPDWFSSLPDLYAFGHLDMLHMLWNAHGFDTTRAFNVPPGMRQLPGLEIAGERLLINGYDCTSYFDAHIECWAWFKENLQHCLKREIEHNEAARDFLSMPDHRRWKICWFRGDTNGLLPYRSIAQATTRHWSTEKAWRNGRLPVSVPIEKWYAERFSLVGKICNEYAVQSEILHQGYWHWRFRQVTSQS